MVLPIAAFIVFTAETASDNGKAGYTGSPNELLCDDCHDAYTINTGGGSVVLSSANMNNWEYVPGQTYNMTLTVARSGSPLFGLGLEALDASNANAGTLHDYGCSVHADQIQTGRLRYPTQCGASARWRRNAKQQGFQFRVDRSGYRYRSRYILLFRRCFQRRR